MLMLLSPAKTLDFESKPQTKISTSPDFLGQSEVLVKQLRKFKSKDIQELMNVSENIADLNVERFKQWRAPFTHDNAKQAMLAFKGDVYTGLEAENFKTPELRFAQKHLRILSGLYGLLRPLDLMQPYRLEMGRKLATKQGDNLYQFWGEQITEALNDQLRALKSDTVVNLASNEYFKAVKPKLLNGQVITPAFKDYKNGDYKVISFFAKKARGMLSRFVIENKLTDVEAIKDFKMDGYKFNNKLSKDNTWTFTRKQ